MGENIESEITGIRGDSDTIKLSIVDYNKLMTNFEQQIAQKWCNTRKMNHQLIGEIGQDDKEKFSILDSEHFDQDDFPNNFRYMGLKY